MPRVRVAIRARWWLVCFLPLLVMATTSSRSCLTVLSNFTPKLTSLSKNLNKKQDSDVYPPHDVKFLLTYL